MEMDMNDAPFPAFHMPAILLVSVQILNSLKSAISYKTQSCLPWLKNHNRYFHRTDILVVQ
jgi:hypothetical protein